MIRSFLLRAGDDLYEVETDGKTLRLRLDGKELWSSREGGVQCEDIAVGSAHELGQEDIHHGERPSKPARKTKRKVKKDRQEPGEDR